LGRWALRPLLAPPEGKESVRNANATTCNVHAHRTAGVAHTLHHEKKKSRETRHERNERKKDSKKR
jgi:hypothetical protein